MKLFCNFLTRRRSNKKKDTKKLSSSSLQSMNQSASPFSDQTSILFDKQTRCTCHYFNLNRSYLAEDVHAKLIPNEPISDSSRNIDCPSDTKYILTVADFCFWYDVRSTLLDIIDQVVTMDEAAHLNTQQIPSTIIKLCLPQSNQIHRRIRRPKTSVAIQTSNESECRRRNAKVQTNTVTLFPLQKQNISSSKLFLN